MSIDILQKLGLVRLPTVDQAMAWLIEHGPVVADPPFPNWVLRQLVRTQRVARLRRGLYLVPRPDGTMLQLPAVAALVMPEGYLSFYGALTLYGLTDQDAAHWGMVTRARQRPLRYGPLTLEFVTWPARVRSAKTRQRTIDGVSVRLATPVQAFCDALEQPRLGASFPEMLRVLRTGLATRALTASALRAHARAVNSPALARRLGLLLELATTNVDQELAAIARRSHAWTSGDRLQERASDSRWRVRLSRSRDDLTRAATS